MKYPIALIALPLMVSSALLSRPATAFERGQDPDQLWSIGWELSERSRQNQKPVRVKHTRKTVLQERERILAKLQQSDLLEELRTPEIAHLRIKADEM
jgi:hypothetical protein